MSAFSRSWAYLSSSHGYEVYEQRLHGVWALSIKYFASLKTIFFISLLSSPSWSEDIGDLVKRTDLYFEKFTDVPFTGKVTGKVQGSIKNGKWDGAVVTYRDDGQLWYKQNYKNGVLEGAFISYNENGQILAKGNHKNDKKEGSWIFYNEDGTILTALTGTYKGGELIE